MKRRIVTLLLAALLLCTAAGCGEKNAADGTENTSAYLRLYCPAELGEKNKSAGGGDAVNGSRRSISWSCCWAAAPTAILSGPCRRVRR